MSTVFRSTHRVCIIMYVYLRQCVLLHVLPFATRKRSSTTQMRSLSPQSSTCTPELLFIVNSYAVSVHQSTELNTSLPWKCLLSLSATRENCGPMPNLDHGRVRAMTFTRRLFVRRRTCNHGGPWRCAACPACAQNQLPPREVPPWSAGDNHRIDAAQPR